MVDTEKILELLTVNLEDFPFDELEKFCLLNRTKRHSLIYYYSKEHSIKSIACKYNYDEVVKKYHNYSFIEISTAISYLILSGSIE